LLESKKTPRETAIALYLGILSRFPTADELKIAESYYQSSQLDRRKATVDLSWALVNTSEFLYRH
jgi:hypothetical protein